MNLLNHMMYSHDSKIRPELVVEMGDQIQPVVPDLKEVSMDLITVQLMYKKQHMTQL